MAWKLSQGGFNIVPEGTHIFKITGCEWDEDFGKLELTLETANGYKIGKRQNLVRGVFWRANRRQRSSPLLRHQDIGIDVASNDRLDLFFKRTHTLPPNADRRNVMLAQICR